VIGFVLSGGANLGSLHVGMLQALLEAGVKPDVVVGTSIGAVNAAHLAFDPSLEQVERLKECWCSVRARDIFPLSPLHNAPALFRTGAFFSPHRWRAFLTRHLPYRAFEETAIFPPHEIDGRCYLDGAISDQLPLKVALEAGAHTVYVMAVSVPSPPVDRRSPFAILRHSLTILLFPRIRLDALDLPGEHPKLRIVQIPSVQTQVSLWDMSRHEELITTAYEATKEFLQAEHDREDGIDVASIPEMEVETQTPEDPIVEA